MPRESSTSNHNADAAINLSKSANTLTDNIPNDVPEDLTSKKPDKANGLDGKKQAISIFIPQSIVEQHSSGQNLLIRPCAPNPFGEHPYNQANNHQTVPVDDLHSVDNDSEGAYLQHSPEDINDIDMMHRSHGYDKDEAKQLEQLEIFAKEFKQRRIKMGFTQGDVGQAMGCLYGNDFSQTTISRFEALNLSFKNMIKLKPLLERWLMDANNVLRESKDGHSVVIPPQTNLDPHTMSRKRKKRTSIDAKKRTTLDRRFLMNPKPSSEELQSIAEECDMEKEVVRVWFCNRRQKEKRISMHEQQVHDVQELSSPDSPERISAPTTSYSVPWKFTEAECEPSTSTVLRRPQNSNNELNPSATVKSFPHNRIKQESQKMAALPAVFGHGVLSNPNQTPILLSAAAAKSKGIQQAVSLHEHKLGPSPSGPNHLFQLNKLDSMAFNNRVQPNHGQSQSKTNNTSLPLPTTTVLNSLLNIGSTSFAMNNSHHTMPSMVNSCTNSDFTLDSKPGAAS